MEQYVGLDVSLKEASLCVYQTGSTLAVADTILWPAARGSGVMDIPAFSTPERTVDPAAISDGAPESLRSRPQLENSAL